MPERMTTIAVVPDTHVPYHDEAAWGLALRALRAIKPDRIVVIGDFPDFYAVSFHSKDPRRRALLREETDAAKRELRRLRGLSDTLDYTEGNHENRLERYLCDRAPALFGLVTSRELLGCDDGAWTWHPYRQILKIGKCHFVHEVGLAGKQAASRSLDAFQGNLVIGHTHRGGIAYDGTMRGDRYFCLNVGWLGDPREIDYAHQTVVRSWQHGLGLVQQDSKGNSWATFCPMIAGKIRIAGRTVV